jgi:hypothetical protein
LIDHSDLLVGRNHHRLSAQCPRTHQHLEYVIEIINGVADSLYARIARRLLGRLEGEEASSAAADATSSPISYPATIRQIDTKTDLVQFQASPQHRASTNPAHRVNRAAPTLRPGARGRWRSSILAVTAPKPTRPRVNHRLGAAPQTVQHP